MKIQELMIGDWISFNYSPQQVTYLNLDDERVATTDEYYAQPIECFEPVSITPEILEKNEFEQLKIITDSYLYKTKLEKVIWSEKGNITIRSAKCDSTFKGICNYVHQLQNLLKVCGIEKRIEV